MFNEATFGKILLPSLGNVNMIMFCMFKGNAKTWKETIEISDLDENKLHNATN